MEKTLDEKIDDLNNKLLSIEKKVDEIRNMIINLPPEDYLAGGLVNVIANLVAERMMKR